MSMFRPRGDRPALSQRRLAAAIAILVMTVQAAHASVLAPKCTPPRPVDLALSLRVQTYVGHATSPGDTGHLEFTVEHLGPTSQGSSFLIRHMLQPLAPDARQPLRLSSVPGELCSVSSFIGTQFDHYGLHYSVQGNVGPSPNGRTVCRVGFEVLSAAMATRALDLQVFPGGCGLDRLTGNNVVTFGFGGPPSTAAPMTDVPALVLLGLGLFLLARWRYRLPH